MKIHDGVHRDSTIKTFAVTEQKQRKHDIFWENLVRDVHAWVTYIELIIYHCNTISQLYKIFITKLTIHFCLRLSY